MKTLLGAQIVPEILECYTAVTEIVPVEAPNEEFMSAETLKAHLKRHNPDVVVVEATTVDESVLQAAENLKLIICTRGNPVNIDLEACKLHSIMVTNTPHRNANAVAEFTVAIMLSLIRQIPEAYMRLKQGEFTSTKPYRENAKVQSDRTDMIWFEPEMEQVPYVKFQGCELLRKTLGIIGFGGIGGLVAKMCRPFNMDILVCDPYYQGVKPSYVSFVVLEKLISRSDIVTLHAKETQETCNMVDDHFFSYMKSGSYLINTSRGRLIKRDALIRAVKNGILRGVALDVFDYEPLSKDDPLLNMPQIICTPHIGGASKDVIFHQSQKTWESLSAFVNKTEIPHRLV